MPRHRSPRLTRPCAGCSAPITRTVASFEANDRRGRKTFCSLACVARTIHTGLPKPKSRANALAARAAGTAAAAAANRKPLMTIVCQMCGQHRDVHPCRIGRARFCSVECRRAERRPLTGAEHPLFKPKTPMPCEMCGTIVDVKPSLVARFRFCSRRCAGAWVSMTWPRTSSLERMLHDVLRALGISFEVEYAIGPYSVDLAFPSARLAVEADGTYWHSRPKQMRRDDQKNRYLHAHGWTVVRFPEVAIRKSPAACIAQIMPMLRSLAQQGERS